MRSKYLAAIIDEQQAVGLWDRSLGFSGCFGGDPERIFGDYFSRTHGNRLSCGKAKKSFLYNNIIFATIRVPGNGEGERKQRQSNECAADETKAGLDRWLGLPSFFVSFFAYSISSRINE